MVIQEEIQSDGDSSSDDWSSLAVIKVNHLSDYCMRALYCRVMLSVNTALSNYTMYWPERTQHCLIAETDAIHSHPPQAVRLPRLSVCDNSQSILYRAHLRTIRSAFFMDQLSINKKLAPYKTVIHIKASPAGATYVLYYRDGLAS